MRFGRMSMLLLAGSGGLLACSSSGSSVGQKPTWTCNGLALSSEAQVQCSTQSFRVTQNYGCTSGSYQCPPEDDGTGDGPSGGGDGDDGTPDASPGDDDSGCGGGTSSGSNSSSGGGSSGASGSGSGCGGDDGGCGPGSPPAGNGGSSGGSSGSGSSGAGSDNDGGVNIPRWQCGPNSRGGVTCARPVQCPPGTHATSSGACVSDAVDDAGCGGGCWVTGGGFIDVGSDKDTFGGNGMPMKAGDVRGEWENIDHSTGDDLHGSVNYLVCNVVPGAGPGHPNGPQHNFDINQVYFGGPARYFVNAQWADGYWFDVVAEDHGEPGRSDTYQITIRTYAGGQAGNVVYKASGTLTGGNIQIHPSNPGHPASASSLPPWVQMQP